MKVDRLPPEPDMQATPIAGLSPAPRWSTDKANAWYAAKPWLVGANYITSDAVNQFEMFQADTFNPDLIDRELALAEGIGMNTMRVFLQDQLWEQDAPGLVQRIDHFLDIATRHGISTMLVLLDSCWDPHPYAGPQPLPIPGIHNSRWAQSPGAERLADPSFEPGLQAYVHGVVSAFANDPRVLAWDIWNEPDNGNIASFGSQEIEDKTGHVCPLLEKAFAWARSANPSQPLTSGVWAGDWVDPTIQSPATKIQLAHSDIITFHDYDFIGGFAARIRQLLPHHRPILCTEYMARGTGSTFQKNLPIAQRYNIGAMSWGFVAGKTQTFLPWDSWQKPYVNGDPDPWFHDIFHTDGTPYRQQEVDFIRRITGGGAATSGAAEHAFALA